MGRTKSTAIRKLELDRARVRACEPNMIALRSVRQCRIGPRWLFDCLGPDQRRHQNEAEANNNDDGYCCDFHYGHWLPHPMTATNETPEKRQIQPCGM
jgi:hypothetical protein